MSEKATKQTEEQPTAVKLPRPQKRIIWVTGSKGGTGKSTFARGLLDLLLEQGVDVAAFDGDPDNSQLYRFYKDLGGGVTRVVITERDGGDDLLLTMEEGKAAVILVDTPAGAREVLANLEDELGFLSALSELNYPLTMVSLLSRVKDSVNQLKYAFNEMADYDVAHVAVKNLFYGDEDKFRIFDAARISQQIKDAGGAVIQMRDLYEDTYELLDDNDLAFQQATSPSEIVKGPDVRRVNSWRNHLKAQVCSANGLLGL